jgi:protoheme ferro-lyase
VTQSALIWMALVVGAIGTGASLVGILVSRRSFEGFFALLGLFFFVACSWGFGGVTLTYDRLDAVIYALVFALAGIAGGYALISTLLGWLARRTGGAHMIPTPLPDDVGKAAVLVLGEVEPADYSPTATAAALEDLAEEGLLSASVGVLPFLFMAQKTRYRAAGGTSPSPKQLGGVAEKLEMVLTGAHSPGKVESAWTEGERSLVSRVAKMVTRGYRDIVVAEATIAESLEVDIAKREVDALRLGEVGVSVAYVGPLWSSERIAGLVTNRILAVAGDESTAGVALVGQGQPEDRARDRRDFDEQETAFLNRIRMMLLERGISDQNVRIAWADWRNPEVTGTIRHLAALGCPRIVVSPACFPFDSITTLLDIQLAVRQARVDESVSVVTLPAWHDDPAFIEELRAEVSVALDAKRVRSHHRVS